MQLKDEQFNAIEHLFPTARGNVKIDNPIAVAEYLYTLK